ncbi:MAG: hypothetical protein QNJ64_15420 [Crocosphaera sp.]|nr:hypothetical protein [Crocosphaera sp.]
MGDKKSQIGLLCFTLLSLFNTSIFAQKNTSQIGSIEANVNGGNNQIYQTINQTIINHPGKGVIQRNQRNYRKNQPKSSRSSSHRHSDTIQHPRKNNH